MAATGRWTQRAFFRRVLRRVRSFSRGWWAAFSFPCFTCCSCGGVRTSSDYYHRPTILIESRTKLFASRFPLLTLMIAAGAYWANRTWGSYWSWDPKETWAAITWLVYAGYLHMRGQGDGEAAGLRTSRS